VDDGITSVLKCTTSFTLNYPKGMNKGHSKATTWRMFSAISFLFVTLNTLL